MKRMIAGLLTVILLLCAFPVAVSAEAATVSASNVWDGTTATGFAGGSGFSADPYQIATPQQLAYLAKVFNDKSITGYRGEKYHYQLTADIYLNDPADFGDPAVENTKLNEWDPIKGFDGTLDGNGHAIVGLYIFDIAERKEADECKGKFGGLFGNHHFNHDKDSTTRHPTIKELAIIDSVIYMPGTYYVSVLGWGEPTIESCYVECDMTVAAHGGIIQAWAGGTVKNTVAAGTLTATNLDARCGAFAEAYNAASSVRYTNCISLVKTNATKFGFVGQINGAASNAQFSNCYMLQPNSEITSGVTPTSSTPGNKQNVTVTFAQTYDALVEATKDKFSSGWTIQDGKLPLNNAFANLEDAYQEKIRLGQPINHSMNMTMLGASIRNTKNDPGLRIGTDVKWDNFIEAFGISESDFDSNNLEAFYEAYQNRIYFGTLFLPLEKLGTTAELTHETLLVENVKAEKVELKKNQANDTVIHYTCAMTQFPQEYYNTAMVARSYVAFRSNPYSEWTIVYNDESIIRTYMGVASMAYESGEETTAFKDTLEKNFGKEELENYSVVFNGVPLEDYQIVISDTADIYLWQTAIKMQRKLVTICGKLLPIVLDTTTPTGKEIWLGQSDRTVNVTPPSQLNTAIYGASENNFYLDATHYYTLYCAVDDFHQALSVSSNVTASFGGTVESVAAETLTWSKDSAYTLVWNDEFDDASLSLEKWSFGNNMNLATHGVHNSTDTDVCYIDENNNLVMVTKQVGTEKYKTNYSVTTHDTMNFSGGYLEMRAMVPFKGKGEWPSFWATSGDSVLFNACYTVPNGVTPVKSGATTAKDVNGYAIEVDFFEVFCNTTTLASNIHRWYSTYVAENYKRANDTAINDKISRHLDGAQTTSGAIGTRTKAFGSSASANGYHNYGFLWTPNEMQFLIDGEMYYTYKLTNHNDSIFVETLVSKAGGANLNLDLSRFGYDHMALSVILTNQMFSRSYATASQYYKDYAVTDSALPFTYTVDYVRLYQTTGNVLYLPEVYGDGTLMFEKDRNVSAQKIVKQ